VIAIPRAQQVHGPAATDAENAATNNAPPFLPRTGISLGAYDRHTCDAQVLRRRCLRGMRYGYVLR
jgi:hypothetical protein